MKPRSQSYVIYVLLFVAIIVLIVFNLNKTNAADTVLSINQLAEQIQKGNISRVVEEENKITVYYADGITEKTVVKENEATLVQQLLH
ncbi:MAG: cell division protein FtsH, partial [Anaerolineae bacterium]|nr:cell division protein FtsH [Anaerolineae bacterium]